MPPSIPEGLALENGVMPYAEIPPLFLSPSTGVPQSGVNQRRASGSVPVTVAYVPQLDVPQIIMKLKNTSAHLLLLASPLALFATPDNDRRIEAAAKESFNYRTVLEDKVTVKASDGVVTLTGKVKDQGDKALAEDTVENLPGVTHVKNEIKVESSHPEKSDGWIAWKIRSRLLVKGNVSATATKVSVVNGVVTLTGTADNEAQKTLTEVYAKEIDGVKSVRNELVVTGNPSSRETMAEKVDDASITTQVKYALLSHKGTSALKTKLETNDGVIVVTGVARSDAEKALVTKLAQDVRGVRSVKNEMTVMN